MLWMLVQPSENGGMGMRVADALDLTIDQAEFFTMTEKEIRKGDAEIRERLRESGALHEAKPLSGAEYLEKLREYYRPGQD